MWHCAKPVITRRVCLSLSACKISAGSGGRLEMLYQDQAGPDFPPWQWHVVWRCLTWAGLELARQHPPRSRASPDQGRARPPPGKSETRNQPWPSLACRAGQHGDEAGPDKERFYSRNIEYNTLHTALVNTQQPGNKDISDYISYADIQMFRYLPSTHDIRKLVSFSKRSLNSLVADITDILWFKLLFDWEARRGVWGERPPFPPRLVVVAGLLISHFWRPRAECCFAPVTQQYRHSTTLDHTGPHWAMVGYNSTSYKSFSH